MIVLSFRCQCEMPAVCVHTCGTCTVYQVVQVKASCNLNKIKCKIICVLCTICVLCIFVLPTVHVLLLLILILTHVCHVPSTTHVNVMYVPVLPVYLYSSTTVVVVDLELTSDM